MKIAVPVLSDNGLDSIIAEHFGHTPYFAFVEIEENEIKKVEIEKNLLEEHAPGEIPEYIHRNGGEVLIARGMGGRAITFFKNLGIKTITGAQGTLKEIIDTFISGSLQSIDYEPDEKFHKH